MHDAGLGSPDRALTELLGSSLYLDELNDQLRNTMYFEALCATLRPDDHVLDVGTGSGLLSCLAVKALQNQGATKPQDWESLWC